MVTTDKCKLIVCIELFRQQLCLGFRNPFTYAGVYYSSRLKEFWCSLSFCNLLKEFKLFMKLNDYFRPSGLFWVQTPWSWQELVGFVLRMSVKHANFKGISLEITYQASYNLLCLETFQRRPSVRQWTARECLTCFLKKNKKKIEGYQICVIDVVLHIDVFLLSVTYLWNLCITPPKQKHLWETELGFTMSYMSLSVYIW